MLSVKNFNIDSNLNCSLSSSPMSPSSDTSNEENSFQHSLGFGVNESNQHISLMGDGITSFAGTITGNGTSNSGSSGVKRKREKLDHLSEEEKLMRRKLKNRISAQTARDRKKEKLSELECKVNQMSKANCLLLKENVELKKKLDLNKLSELLKHNEQLQAENKQLRERLDALESKINNDYIRVTSQPTVRNISSKSNNKIKVESNSESLAAEKSKVNSIESAEEPGANQRDLSDLDQAISSLINFDGDECEEIIKWLHRCSEQLLDQNIDQLSEDSGIEDGGSHSDEASNRLSPASEEPKERDLESIRDLITFDHMYHRNDFLVQPQVDEMTVTTTSPITVETESILTDNCVKNTTSFSENSPKPSTSNTSSLCYPSLPQPNDNLVNKPLNFFNPIDSSILSSESAFYESNLNLFDDLFPELI